MTRGTLALSSGLRVPDIMMKCFSTRLVRDFSDSLASVCHVKYAQKYKNLDKKKVLFCLFILSPIHQNTYCTLCRIGNCSAVHPARACLSPSPKSFQIHDSQNLFLLRPSDRTSVPWTPPWCPVSVPLTPPWTAWSRYAAETRGSRVTRTRVTLTRHCSRCSPSPPCLTASCTGPGARGTLPAMTRCRAVSKMRS